MASYFTTAAATQKAGSTRRSWGGSRRSSRRRCGRTAATGATSGTSWSALPPGGFGCDSAQILELEEPIGQMKVIHVAGPNEGFGMHIHEVNPVVSAACSPHHI